MHYIVTVIDNLSCNKWTIHTLLPPLTFYHVTHHMTIQMVGAIVISIIYKTLLDVLTFYHVIDEVTLHTACSKQKGFSHWYLYFSGHFLKYCLT